MRLEARVGYLLREAIRGKDLDRALEPGTSNLAEFRKCLSSYLADAGGFKELISRVKGIPHLVEASSGVDAEEFSSRDEGWQSCEPLPTTIQAIIAEEAALAIMGRLVTDSVNSCKHNSLDLFILGFYEVVLNNLGQLPEPKDELREVLSPMVEALLDEAKERLLSIKESMAVIRGASSELIASSLATLQKIQPVQPTELPSISQKLYDNLGITLVPLCEQLSTQLHSHIDEAKEQLNNLLTNPN